MIDLQAFVLWLAKLVNDKFFGKIELTFDKGNLVHVKKTEAFDKID